MSSSTARQRVLGFFRNRRVRAAIFIIGGYKAYTTFKTYTTLNKTFSASRHRPGQTILDLDLDAVQVVSKDSLSAFSTAEELRLAKLISTIQDAKSDPRVTGLVVRGLAGLRGVGLAEICELRDVVTDFSTGWGGKQTVLHVAEGLGGSGNGTVPLYFASAFDSVHVQPTSGIIIPGLSAATLFFKHLLENVGIKAKKVARKEFKTAANSFTEDKFTDPHRESTEALLSAIMADIVKGVADGRGISEESVRAAIDAAIMSPKEAQQFGIIDEPLYRDELPQVMREKLRMSQEARAEARKEAEVEWRDAMADLKHVWTQEGGINEAWAEGALLQNVSEFQTAVPVALSFADLRHERSKETTAAEIRALKAHVRWLDTCPWEAVGDKERDKYNVFRTESNISSLLEAERRLCESAIMALEECPQLVESVRKALESDDVVQLKPNNALSLVRWCRSLWRAKCMAARIVGTLVDSEEELKQVLKSDPEESVRESLKAVASEPRLFLLGFTDELRRAALAEGDGLPEDSSVPEKDKGEKPESEKGKKRNLRYIKFSDYVDTLNAEKRAVLDRSGSFVKFENADPFQKLSGTVDFQERNMLLRLQLPGHRFAPWRLNVPKGDVIAVINIQGPISDDKADTTRAAIRRADKDPHVKGIVLRIDSPGGSATASDLISRAVEVAKKPVVASMGSVCASGGYFISAPCDKVFASNMTITGSIGVIFSAFNTAGLFEKLGITADSCESGRFSKYFGMQGSITEWSDEFATRIDTMIDNFYDDFVKVVAKGRGMQFEQAERIAKGRVWAGSDALSLGLVDEIGGLREAVQAAAELAYLAPDAKVRAVDYPTVAMQVQDAARRRGLIPSNLDEEGDESIPQRRKGWFGSKSKKPQDPEPSDAPREPQSAPAAIVSQLSSEYEGLCHFVVNRVLTSLDRFLLSTSVPSRTSDFVDMVLSQFMATLRQDRTAAILSEELERTRATAGRASAIAQNVRIDE